MRAEELKRHDQINVLVTFEVMSIKPIGKKGLMKIKVAAHDTKSLKFPDDKCALEIICKPGRDFYTWRPGEDLAIPTYLEPVE
jgi:hypothetical protein